MAREGRGQPIQSIEIREVTAVGRSLEQCLAWLKLEEKKEKEKEVIEEEGWAEMRIVFGD